MVLVQCLLGAVWWWVFSDPLSPDDTKVSEERMLADEGLVTFTNGKCIDGCVG